MTGPTEHPAEAILRGILTEHPDAYTYGGYVNLMADSLTLDGTWPLTQEQVAYLRTLGYTNDR